MPLANARRKARKPRLEAENGADPASREIADTTLRGAQEGEETAEGQGDMRPASDAGA